MTSTSGSRLASVDLVQRRVEVATHARQVGAETGFGLQCDLVVQRAEAPGEGLSRQACANGIPRPGLQGLRARMDFVLQVQRRLRRRIVAQRAHGFDALRRPARTARRPVAGGTGCRGNAARSSSRYASIASRASTGIARSMPSPCKPAGTRMSGACANAGHASKASSNPGSALHRRQHRQLQPLLPRTLLGDLVARIRMPHHARCRDRSTARARCAGRLPRCRRRR